MKNILKKFFTLFLFVITVVGFTACGKKKKDKTEDKESYYGNPNINISDEMKDDMFKDVELHELTLSNPDAFSNTFMDVEPDFALHLVPKGAYLSVGEVSNSVEVKDSFGLAVESSITEVSLGDLNGYSITANGGYKKGEAYTMSIHEEVGLLFHNKDESIKKIIFTVKEQDRDVCVPKKDYKTYDIDKVSYFSGYGDFDTYLIYNGKFSSQVGDIVLFDGADDGEKIYIKITKIEKNKSTYKISYVSPDAKDLFSDLNLHADNKAVDLKNNLHLKEKEEIIQQIKESTLAEDYLAYAAYAYNFDKELMMSSKEFWDHVYIDLSFQVQDNTFTTKLSISFTFTLDSGWRIILFANFKYTETYNTSGGVRFDTILGIPYNVSMNVAMSSNVNIQVEFRGCVANPKFPKSWAKAKANPDQFSQRDAEEAVEELRDSWVEAKALDYENNQIEGDTFMLNLGSVTLRFWGWLAIDFELFLCIKNQLNITFGVGYTYNYTKTVVSYASDSDSSDAGSSPSAVTANTINASLCGKYSAELFLKGRVSIYITGFKWLIYLHVDVDGGLYLDVKGIAAFTWDITTGTPSGDGGVYVEFGLFFRVTLGVNILDLVHPTITLVDKKFPIYIINLMAYIDGRGSTDTIELNKNVTDTQSTTLFYYDVFDINALDTVRTIFKGDEEITYYKSSFDDFEIKYHIFTNISSDNPDINIVNNQIVVNDGVAEAEATIKYTIDTGLSTREDSIKVHFLSSDANFVTFDGQNQKAYLPGQQIEFPSTVDKRDGYIFLGYMLNGKLITSQEGYIMGDEDLNFESYYVQDIKYQVKFFDHKGNLIKTYDIRKGEDAVAPEFAPNDGYDFICWDKPYDNIQGNLNVYAICSKRGEA